MPALKKGETWNPRYGVGDVVIVGDGIADFSEAYRDKFYINIGLTFGNEEGAFSGELDKEGIFSKLNFTNDPSMLIDEGYTEQEAKEIEAAVDVLCKYIERNITGSNPAYEKPKKWTGGPLLSEKDGIITIHPTDKE